jgi:hypothetical protein
LSAKEPIFQGDGNSKTRYFKESWVIAGGVMIEN